MDLYIKKLEFKFEQNRLNTKKYELYLYVYMFTFLFLVLIQFMVDIFLKKLLVILILSVAVILITVINMHYEKLLDELSIKFYKLDE